MAFQYKVIDGEHWCICKIDNCTFVTSKYTIMDRAVKKFGAHLLSNHSSDYARDVRDIELMFGNISR